jgi:hypothetical protein
MTLLAPSLNLALATSLNICVRETGEPLEISIPVITCFRSVCVSRSQLRYAHLALATSSQSH